MSCDCAFYIGTTHEVCQDYALAGENTVCVADGCSGSLLSDFGSRVLSVTAMNKMTELDTLFEFDEKEIILLARPSAKVLNLPPECLDATLLCAAKKDKVAEAICYGDGVIAAKMEDGGLLIIAVEYVDSYPFYVNYMFDKSGRFRNWKEHHNKRRIVFSTVSPEGEVEVVTIDMENNPRVRYDSKDVGLLRIRGDFGVMVELVAPDVESVAVMSDGVQSFYHPVITDTSNHNEKVEYHDVLKELMRFRNYTGRFVQRRMNKFKKTCVKNGWEHSDDVSIAAIYMGE